MPDYDAIIKAVENDKPLPKNVIDIPDVKESHTSYINRMQELNERIAQLTNLVKSGKETISATEEMLKLAEQERDRLADCRRESEPKFERVNRFESYWALTFNGCAYPSQCMDDGVRSVDDNNNFKYNNYFKTVQRADEVADKINFLLKLERLHDTFCPDYVPDWNREDWKYFVYYNNTAHYRVNSAVIFEHKTGVFFPTKEIAQKVCDILNKELEEKI